MALPQFLPPQEGVEAHVVSLNPIESACKLTDFKKGEVKMDIFSIWLTIFKEIVAICAVL